MFNNYWLRVGWRWIANIKKLALIFFKFLLCALGELRRKTDYGLFFLRNLTWYFLVILEGWDNEHAKSVVPLCKLLVRKNCAHYHDFKILESEGFLFVENNNNNNNNNNNPMEINEKKVIKWRKWISKWSSQLYTQLKQLRKESLKKKEKVKPKRNK